jgi:hypothetical protein
MTGNNKNKSRALPLSNFLFDRLLNSSVSRVYNKNFSVQPCIPIHTGKELMS